MAFDLNTNSQTISNTSTGNNTQYLTRDSNNNNNNISNHQQQQQQQQQQMSSSINDLNLNEHDSTDSNDELCSNSSHLLLQQNSGNLQQYPIINRCNDAAIANLLQRTGYPLVQENGQRKYGPPQNWNLVIPNVRGCEIFVGKLPRDCFEDELVPLFEKIGLIYELRLMMDFNGYNRGFAFVMFSKRDEAKRAVKDLNNYEIRKNKFIGVCFSVDNCRLFVGGIPKNKKKEEILEEIKKVTEHVKDVIVYPTAHDKTKNRGFAFVEYQNHKAAAMARRKLFPGRIQLWGHQIAVDWAEPETEVDEEIMANVKNLYVRNLMLTTTEEQIKNEFEKLKKGSVERVKKLKDYAFVHFKEREDAVNAKNILNGTLIDGSLVEILFAKPVDKNYIRMTRGVLNPATQFTGVGLSPSQLIPGALHLANTIPMQFSHLPPNQFSILPAPLSPNTNSRLAILQPHHSLATSSGQQEYPMYDMYSPGLQIPGLDVPMMSLNQLPIKQYPLAKSQQTWQVLEDICAKQGLGMPTYTLHTTDGRDLEGREVGLYLYKVSIPGFMNGAPIVPKALSCNIDEAKNNAAENILAQLGIQTIPLQPNEFYNPTLMPQSQAIYQGRPLSTAHAVNLSQQTSTSTTNTTTSTNATNNNVSSLVTQAQSIPTTTNNRPQILPTNTMLPEYVPIMAPPYYYDPSAQYVVGLPPPPPPPPNGW